EIVSIEGVIFSGLCSQVVVPSISGDMGIMSQHEAFIVKLREGDIYIFDEKNVNTKNFKVNSGFAEMTSEDKLTIILN
ncbi:MAG: F0F1 ATP synthase subunit epsilon, partial [Alphaproteobacteria bacterium]